MAKLTVEQHQEAAIAAGVLIDDRASVPGPTSPGHRRMGRPPYRSGKSGMMISMRQAFPAHARMSAAKITTITRHEDGRVERTREYRAFAYVLDRKREFIHSVTRRVAGEAVSELVADYRKWVAEVTATLNRQAIRPSKNP